MSSSRLQQGAAAAGGFVAAQAAGPKAVPAFVDDYPRLRLGEFAPLADELTPLGEVRAGPSVVVSAAELEACAAQRERELAQERERVADLQQRLDQGRDAQLVALAQELKASVEQQCRDLAKVAARLAFEAAERVLRRELSSDPEAVERLLADLLWRLADARDLRVRANPQDATYLQQRPDRLAELRVAEVVPDRRITRGGCVVEANDNSWDASVEGQIEQLRTAIRRVLDEP